MSVSRMRRPFGAVVVAVAIAVSGVVTAPVARAEEVFTGNCTFIVELTQSPPNFDGVEVDSLHPGNCLVTSGDGTVRSAKVVFDGWAQPWMGGMPFSCIRGFGMGGMHVSIRIPSLGDRVVDLPDALLRLDYAAGLMQMTMALDTPAEHLVGNAGAFTEVPFTTGCAAGTNPTRWFGEFSFEAQLDDGPIP